MVRRSPRFRQNLPETDSDAPENLHQASEARQAQKTAKSMRLFFENSRPVQADDILWFICFFVTMYFLNVPYNILFHHKVDWLYLSACGFTIVFIHVVAVLIRFYNLKNQQIRPVYGALLAIFGSVIASWFFALATWEIYNVWSLFISFVTVMTYIAFISVI